MVHRHIEAITLNDDTIPTLHKINVGQGLDGLGLHGQVEVVSCLGLSIRSLKRFSFRFSSTNKCLVLIILVSASKDLLLSGRSSKVGGSDVKVLFKDTSVDFLIDGDANGSLGNIKDNTRAAVVISVRHTLVNG